MTTSSPLEAALYVLGKLCEPRPQRVSKRERMLACAIAEINEVLRAGDYRPGPPLRRAIAAILDGPG